MRKTRFLALVAASCLMAGMSVTCAARSGRRRGSVRARTAKRFLRFIGYEVKSDEYRLLSQAVEYYFAKRSRDLTVREMKAAHAIVAFSFGQGKPSRRGEAPSPGATNEGLAAIAADLQALTGKPVYAQWEIAHVMSAAHSASVACRAEAKKGYLSTVGVIDRFAKAGLKPGRTVILVASHEHGFRVRKLLEKRGYRVLTGRNGYVPKGGWRRFAVDDDYGYTKASTQIWTRSRANFICEELYWLVHELHEGRLDP